MIPIMIMMIMMGFDAFIQFWWLWWVYQFLFIDVFIFPILNINKSYIPSKPKIGFPYSFCVTPWDPGRPNSRTTRLCCSQTWVLSGPTVVERCFVSIICIEYGFIRVYIGFSWFFYIHIHIYICMYIYIMGLYSCAMVKKWSLGPVVMHPQWESKLYKSLWRWIHDHPGPCG
jgi:hypothetical protein